MASSDHAIILELVKACLPEKKYSVLEKIEPGSVLKNIRKQNEKPTPTCKFFIGLNAIYQYMVHYGIWYEMQLNTVIPEKYL